ncbi:AzlC family ABC transporter permease [Methanosarcina sp. UBA5]|uniref:AzlC family ABC transporter permease n=1 Tax=Methanosarcina sp. UBA5 TaxID=1915593 RepID=UPI0025E9BCCC|nr:AzlC family ABC transporter permease [Methanosarcina sp. UBA5]
MVRYREYKRGACERNKDLFITAFKTTIPVLLGYIPLGMAFGFLLDGAGYHWIYAFIMSLFVYAGSGQFLAVALLSAGAGLTEFAIATLLLNFRHAFYGLSLLEKFSGVGKVKPYLIFALTDETYALLTTTNVPQGISKSRFYFYIAALDHLYWIAGSVLGAALGSVLDLNLEGMSFVLAALFVVLTIEQYFSSEARFPFIAAIGAGALSLILFSPDNMLLASIVLGTLILIVREKSMQRTQREQKIQETRKTQEMKEKYKGNGEKPENEENIGIFQVKKEIRSINTSIQPVEDKIKEEN